MKWGVWYIHPRQSFLLTGGMSRSGTRCHHPPHTPPNCSPTPPHRLRTPSGVRIRRVPEGSLHSFCQRLTAQAREPRPQPRSWDPAPKSAAPQQAPPPLNPTHSNSAWFSAFCLVFVGLFGGLLGVCGVLGVWWLYGCCLRRPRSDPWTIVGERSDPFDRSDAGLWLPAVEGAPVLAGIELLYRHECGEHLFDLPAPGTSTTSACGV